VTLAAAALVVVLALGALLWPRGVDLKRTHTLLVYDSSGSAARTVRVFAPLREYMREMVDGPLELVVVRSVPAFRTRLAEQPDFIFAPDGLALQAAGEQYGPLVVGRRAAPQNLRPRSVLVFRRSAPDEPEPWRTRTGATVFGDSVSLTGVDVLRAAADTSWPPSLACGPDPYDHAPVLHALRLGTFDFAVVRQWDADRFFSEGLLDQGRFGVRSLVGPVPDVVLLASRRVPQRVRLRCGEGLSSLGRLPDSGNPRRRELDRALRDLDLAGFNLLLEPDFESVRKNYPRDWLPGGD